MSTTFDVKVTGLSEFIGDLKKASSETNNIFKKATVSSINTIKNFAQRIVAYKTGTLRRSIQAEMLSTISGVVYQDSDMARYGKYIEFGTSAHTIYPVGKKALFWKGASHPIKSVRHPGFAPRPFMSPAFEENKQKVQDFFDKAMQDIISIMKGTK